MALPTGTISFQHAGRLRVFLSARYTRASTDAGFPSSSDGNIKLRAYVGPSGSYVYTPSVDKYSLSANIEVAYPGGNAVWDIGAEVVATAAASGTVTVAMRDIRVAWELVIK